ncbi:MAG: amino acid permease [Rhodospirillaceae bacterium]|nr:MAG: amino acid permease [Rhodospirillaceae bacterium]
MTAQMPKLKRTLGLVSLTLYGLGIIIGAGIYVLVGAVAGQAGMAAPLAFLIAGILAAFTGLSYAELGQRLPDAAGAAVYAQKGFQSSLAGRLTGYATLLVAVVSAASVTRGGAGYLLAIVDIPLPLASGAVIIIFTALACWGVKESVYIASSMTVLEICGLGIVIFIGADALGDLPQRISEMWPKETSAWIGVMGGTFLAFFAFSGFEAIVHMAEETENVKRTLPRAVVLSIGLSALLYMLVISISVLTILPTDLAASNAPLCLVVDCDSPNMALFPIIAIIATLNGVLIEIVLMARITYGMANRKWLPGWLSGVHAKRQTPMLATVCVGMIVFVLATTFDFEPLARVTSALILIVFVIVNMSLVMLKRRHEPVKLSLEIPAWVPIFGALSSLAVLIAELFWTA